MYTCESDDECHFTIDKYMRCIMHVTLLLNYLIYFVSAQGATNSHGAVLIVAHITPAVVMTFDFFRDRYYTMTGTSQPAIEPVCRINVAGLRRTQIARVNAVIDAYRRGSPALTLINR